MSTETPLGLLTDPEKKVQGTALYAEFKNEYQQIFQMFITPDGWNELGNFSTARVYYRRLSASQPKKQWKVQAPAWSRRPSNRGYIRGPSRGTTSNTSVVYEARFN